MDKQLIVASLLNWSPSEAAPKGHYYKSEIKKYLLILYFGLMLAGCNGGDDKREPQAPDALSFSPTMITETYGEGESLSFSVTATTTSELDGAAYIYIVDKTGIIQENPQITQNLDGTYTILMSTSGAVPAGSYQDSIEVKLCQDFTCTSQYPGSPSYLNFDIQVLSSTNLTPLVQWIGVNDWETFQADTTHAGYVPVTLNANNFSPRWRWIAPESGNTVSPSVNANGLVYVSSSGYFATSSKLYALNESDGSEEWSNDFGSVFSLNPPAVSGGSVFAATSGHTDTFMWGFSADLGAQQFSTAFSSQWEHYYAPTVDNGVIYTNGGYYGGLNSFNTSDGTDYWFTDLNQYDKWTPAVDANYTYAYLGESCSGCNNAGLTIMNKSTGAIVYTIPDPQHNWTGWSINGSPVIGSNNTVFAINQANNIYTNHLVSFNTQTLSVNWALPGIFNINPAIANGIIYLVNKSPLQLEARDEATGSLLWTWSPTRPDETAFYGNITAVDNMVFVSTNKKVYAIDTGTHAAVWNYWKPGELAISNNGVLYITTSDGNNSDGALVAINLK